MASAADAISAIFELVRFANTKLTVENSMACVKAVYDEIVELSDILGLIVEKKEEILAEDIEKLIEERQAARKAKNFARADEIRDLLRTKKFCISRYYSCWTAISCYDFTKWIL